MESSVEQRKRSRQLLRNTYSSRQGSKSWFESLEASIQADPTYAPAYREMSVWFTKRGDYLNAYRLLNKAVKLNPKDALGYRGWLKLYKIHDYEGAIKDFEEANSLFTRTIHPSGENVYYLIGLAKKQLGAYDEAIMNFTSCERSELSSGARMLVYPDVWIYRGICYRKTLRYELALKDFELAKGSYSNSVESCFQLALTFLEMDQTDLAQENFHNALNLAKAGYIKSNPYKDLFDQIYVEEIAEYVKNLEMS